MNLKHRIRSRLSHNPGLYALIVGIGIVLFWRGAWHSIDQLHVVINHLYNAGNSISFIETPWWDGPLSFVVGCIVLYFTGAFTSSFIGNELILSGLRGEKKLNQKTEAEVQTEVIEIADIKDELEIISRKLSLLQKQNHKE